MAESLAQDGDRTRSGRLDSRARRAFHCRRVASKFRQEHPGRHDEIAAVPKEAVTNVALGGLLIGLLYEGGNGRQPPSCRRNIAISWRRLRRLHPQGDDTRLPRAFRRSRHRSPESVMIGDMMIRREKGVHAFGIANLRPNRRRRHGRC
ncbi:hypothetical protein D3C80_1614200 [compost metagenome]